MGAPSSDKAAIRQTIRALRKAGYTLTGGHDGEDFFEAAPDASEDSLIADLMACDSSTLHTWKDGEGNSHVYFVLGNDPEEVICDHGVSLSPVLDPLTEGWWE
jgi:DNA-binding response OmpR family regulator